MNKYYFQDKARSERYFTATLLAHLLMANNFEGTKLLFKYLKKDDNFDEGTDFEIVTELDPLRDASVSDKDIQLLFKDHGRVAVPDIFIRWGRYAFVIEAKFFTLPYPEDLEYQVSEQKRAISLIIDKTRYDINKIQYYLLLITNPGGFTDNTIPVIVWDDLIELFENKISMPVTDDVSYSLGIIKHSVKRAKAEIQKQSKVTYKQIKTIHELITKLPQLLNDGKIYVGFSEGFYTNEFDLDYLEKRSHYRISDTKYSNNWIRIEDLIAKYISLKY